MEVVPGATSTITKIPVKNAGNRSPMVATSKASRASAISPNRKETIVGAAMPSRHSRQVATMAPAMSRAQSRRMFHLLSPFTDHTSPHVDNLIPPQCGPRRVGANEQRSWVVLQHPGEVSHALPVQVIGGLV